MSYAYTLETVCEDLSYVLGQSRLPSEVWDNQKFINTHLKLNIDINLIIKIKILKNLKTKNQIYNSKTSHKICNNPIKNRKR